MSRRENSCSTLQMRWSATSLQLECSSVGVIGGAPDPCEQAGHPEIDDERKNLL